MLGQATIKTIYCYLGYYNVCHLGAEIKNPQKNIPRSIFISVIGISVIYLLMQVAVLGVIPWREAKESSFVVSAFFEKIYGTTAASIATVLILWIAFASLFSVILGYSRIPYAAAVDGNYFSVFKKVHPTKIFPHASLLILCAVAFLFSMMFKLKEVISTIVVIRILIQFISQAIGVILIRRKKETLPFRMALFPLPAIIAIFIWFYVFISSEPRFIFYAVGVIASGAFLFLTFAKRKGAWPFIS